MTSRSAWKRIKVAGRPAQHDKRVGHCFAGVSYDSSKKRYRWTVQSAATIDMKVPYIEPRSGSASSVAAARKAAGAVLKTCARQASV